MTRTDATQSV